MRVLALTHAHLKADGLSPVSCERADSIVGAWGGQLNWDVDVVHTKDTKWPGIWPGGKGLKVNIILAAPPLDLKMEAPELFSKTLKTLWAKKQIAGAFSLVAKRIKKRAHASLAQQGFLMPGELVTAKKWGNYLYTLKGINGTKYDFIFVCVGYGDEYLLQTAMAMSEKLNAPMVVDFRDLWSDHHEPARFTNKQRRQIRKIEKKLLVNTSLISVPQKHMALLLKKWTPIPVHYLSHSAYIGTDWHDGHVVSGEFTMLYAGKLYASGPGLEMLLGLIKKLSQCKLPKPFKCHFFVDDTAKLNQLIKLHHIEDYVAVNGWIRPSELWKHTRSAHLLLLPDSGVAENYPIIPTKTFQYAYSGRQILCLLKYKNEEMQEFLDLNGAGTVCTDVETALAWVMQAANEKSQYESLPPLRKVVLREEMAIEFGKQIEKIIA